MKVEEIFNLAIECFKKYNSEKVILFGSWARGDMDEYSDMDFVIIKKTKKRFLQRLAEVARFIDNRLPNIDVFVYTPLEFKGMIERENPFIQNVLEEGKVVYEKRQRRSSSLVKTGKV